MLAGLRLIFNIEPDFTPHSGSRLITYRYTQTACAAQRAADVHRLSGKGLMVTLHFGYHTPRRMYERYVSIFN